MKFIGANILVWYLLALVAIAFLLAMLLPLLSGAAKGGIP